MIAGRVGIIGGAGWLGSAIAHSLVSSGTVDPTRLICSYRSTRPAKPADWKWTQDNAELAASSDIIIVSVRPGDWPSLPLEAPEQLVIYVTAGVRIVDLQEHTGAGRLARVRPERRRAGQGFLYANLHEVRQSRRRRNRACPFETCGSVDLVTEEDHIDYFTGMSGSGPAFPALLAEAMMGRRHRSRNSLRDRAGGGAPNLDRRRTYFRGASGHAGRDRQGFRRLQGHDCGRNPENAVQGGLEAAYLKAQALSRKLR